MIRAILAFALLACVIAPAEARQHHKTFLADPNCNILWPCEGVAPSPRGERIVKAMGGFGSAQKVYTSNIDRETKKKPRVRRTIVPGVQTMSNFGIPSPSIGYTVQKVATQVIGGRPSGCPHAFCGCGASLHIFGKIIPSLNLAANWLRFPRAAPAPGMVAARYGHVFVLEQHIGGNVWLAHDSNSGRGLTRLHARSIAGYTVVNPHGGSA